VDFADSAADAQSFSAFPATDAGFAALPTVSFITPSDPDNMTDTIASPMWAQDNNSLLIIACTPNQVATIGVGAGIPARVSNSQPANGCTHWQRPRTCTD
jgi:hypothetical protein